MHKAFKRWHTKLFANKSAPKRPSQGMVNANNSFDFDRKVKDVVVRAANFPKFSEYFKNKLQPSINTDVEAPSRNAITINNWMNNNCESLNHIMKFDANWKVKNSPELMRMLHEMTLLHFKDFRGALYGTGNYRLFDKYRKHKIPRNVWKKLSEDDRQERFSDFVQNKIRSKGEQQDYVVSTYSNFRVPALNMAKKPGQKSRLKSSKTKNIKNS